VGVVVVNNLDIVLLANLFVGGSDVVVDGDDDDPIASAMGVVVDVAITTIANIAKRANDVDISICVTINCSRFLKLVTTKCEFYTEHIRKG
jgi:hypothetical protein